MSKGIRMQELVLEYLEKFPKTPSLTLAKLIHKDYPWYCTVDSARSTIRRLRGSMGKVLRAKSKIHIPFESSLCPFDSLPEGLKDYADWSTYVLESKSLLILADIHAPYHDKESLTISLQHGKSLQPDTIVLLGDFMDFISVSFWERDPRKRNFQHELEVGRQILQVIRTNFPNSKIIIKIGNHEERLERYLRVKAPELLGYEYLTYAKLLDPTGAFGINIVPDCRIMKIDHLNMVHGHEFGRMIASPVNPARGLYMRGKEIALCGHHHQTSQHTEKTMTGDIVSCWSVGCLCDLHPEYMPINKWNHGFAHVQIQDNSFVLNNYKIINGRVFNA